MIAPSVHIHIFSSCWIKRLKKEHLNKIRSSNNKDYIPKFNWSLSVSPDTLPNSSQMWNSTQIEKLITNIFFGTKCVLESNLLCIYMPVLATGGSCIETTVAKFARKSSVWFLYFIKAKFIWPGGQSMIIMLMVESWQIWHLCSHFWLHFSKT